MLPFTLQMPPLWQGFMSHGSMDKMLSETVKHMHILNRKQSKQSKNYVSCKVL